jgi:hypothetical protein
MWPQEIPEALAEIITRAKTSAAFDKYAVKHMRMILEGLETGQNVAKAEPRQKSYKGTRPYREIQQKCRDLGIWPLTITDFRDIARTVLAEIPGGDAPGIKKDALYRTLEQHWDAVGEAMLRVIEGYSAAHGQARTRA